MLVTGREDCASQVDSRYNGVKTRFLQDKERLIPTAENTLPLVIEPATEQQGNVDFLQSFLSQHSDKMKHDIATYGAVLLRGFQVYSTAAFEETILSIQGMRGMSHLFMSEPGRERVDGLKYVFHTNSKIKTGGTFHLGGFHTENYYSPDVPAYISFCCLNPAKLGGETGLINMSRVYEKLDLLLKEALEKKSFFVAKWPVGVIAGRYQMNPSTVKTTCDDFGLSIDENNCVVMHKPSVFQHPISGKKIIQANLCAEIPALNDALLNHFMSDYRGWQWMLHKALWKYVGYHRIRQWSLILPALMSHPIKFLKMRKLMKQRMRQYNNKSYPRINSVFKADDIKTLAAHMRDSYASILWEKGDVLLIDNLQVAHAGMPGKTSKQFSRKIRAMMCNPFKIPYSHSASGLQPTGELLHETLGEIMHQMNLKK